MLPDTLSETSSILNELSQDGSNKTNNPIAVSSLNQVTKSLDSPTVDLSIVKKEPTVDGVGGGGDTILGRDIKVEPVDNCDDISDDEYFNGKWDQKRHILSQNDCEKSRNKCFYAPIIFHFEII